MKSIDLRGVKCPLNYVKAKLSLEELDPGQDLEILLDDGEPILNVPRSIKDDGDKIIAVTRIDDHFKVVARKI